uniref:Transposase n=1 Tax=Ascaris lumbricoides TaxID=6252 RepID=A0A0M3IED5_ASCLU
MVLAAIDNDSRPIRTPESSVQMAEVLRAPAKRVVLLPVGRWLVRCTLVSCPVCTHTRPTQPHCSYC